MARPKPNGSPKETSTANIGFEAQLVDCMFALPGQLFYSTQIPVCLWFLGKNEPTGKWSAVSKLELALAA